MKSLLCCMMVVVAALFCIETHAFSRMSSHSVTYDYLRIKSQLAALNDDVPPEVMSSVSDLVSNMAAGKLDKEVFEEQIAEKAKLINQARDQKSKSLQLATLVGSGVVGLTLGLVADAAVGDTINPAILPTTAIGLLSGGAYYVQSAQTSSSLQPLLLKYIGAPTLSAGESISNSIKDIVKKKQQALNKKKEDTIDYIESIPTRIQDSIEDSIDNAKKQALAKVDNTNKQIANIPNAIAQYFVKLADDTKASINRKAQETVSEIQATPQRVAKKITNAIDALVGRAKALPGKVAQQVTGAVDAKTKEAKKALNKKVSSVQSSVIKAVPKVPNVSIPLPAVKLPTVPVIKPNPPNAAAAKETPKLAPTPQAAATIQQKVPVKTDPIKLPPLPKVTLPTIPLPQVSLPSKEERPVVVPKAPAAVAAKPKPALVAVATSKSSPSPSSNGVFGSLFGGSSSVKASPKSSSASTISSTPKESSTKSAPSTTPKSTSSAPVSTGLFSFGFKSKAPSSSTPKPIAEKTVDVKPTAAVPQKPTTAAAPINNGLFSFGTKTKSSPSLSKPASPPPAVTEIKAASTSVPPPKSLFSFGSTSTPPKAASLAKEAKGSSTVDASAKPTFLSPAAIKTLKSVKANDTEISKIDNYLQTFSKGGVSAENLYAQVADALGGNKSNAFSVLPDLIGSLPKGTSAKRDLNSFYQQKA